MIEQEYSNGKWDNNYALLLIISYTYISYHKEADTNILQTF